MSTDLRWSNDDSFELDGTTFFIAPFAPRPSRPDRFILAKPRWMLEWYIELASEVGGGRIVELGIAKGGSVAFFAHLYRPTMLLALEIAEEPVETLVDFIEAHGYTGSVRAAFGVNQGDGDRVEEVARSSFGTESLDLVIDDASHILGPTLTSFTTFFPRLRPGGIFVLEDWSHDHTWERAMRAEPDERFGPAEIATHTEKPPEESDLSSLVVKLVLAAAYVPEVVADVHVRDGFAVVRRGDATLDPTTFDLASCYGDAGRAVLARDDVASTER